MSAQNTSGAGKRKGHELQTDAFKKKGSLATASRPLEGYSVKRFSKGSIISSDGTRTTTTKVAINRSKARAIVDQLIKYFGMRPRGPPQGLNLDTISIARIDNAAYVVKMLFNRKR
jgi:hypothetical protein